jgi:hypothetical protein
MANNNEKYIKKHVESLTPPAPAPACQYWALVAFDAYDLCDR